MQNIVDNIIVSCYTDNREKPMLKGIGINMLENGGVKKNFSVRDITYIAMFTALMAICSWISIPFAVPFTLQTLGVFCTLGLLGGKRGTAAIGVYILLGAFGMPVFSGFKGGFGVLLGQTGGYIIGFLCSALIYWLITGKYGSRLSVMAAAMTAGLLICYAFGTAWFMVVYTKNTGAVGLGAVLGWCVLPFMVPDAVKLATALLLTNRLKKYTGLLK